MTPNALPHLPLARYRLTFTALDPLRLPEYSGSAWRGLFGHALKRLVCVTRQPACAGCLLYRSCTYPYLFETPPDPDVGKLRKYNAAPHPLVLQPDMDTAPRLAPGDHVALGLTLFGRGNQSLPYVIHALDQGARRGFGKQRGRLELALVEQETDAGWQPIHRAAGPLQALPARCPEIPPCPAHFTLRLLTPLRIKYAERNLTPAEFRFAALFSNLLRRISLLTAFHGDTPLETDFAGLKQAAQAIEVAQASLHWHDWTRYSSRQDTLMQLGEITLSGEALTPFWPYLWLGQWTHAGKNTSMGLGRYRIDIAAGA